MPRSTAGARASSARRSGRPTTSRPTILGVVVCILLLRGLEYALAASGPSPRRRRCTSPPPPGSAGSSPARVPALENAIVVVAAVKILVSLAWMITIALQPTMGVAWHRFLAFPNIWFKRHAPTGRTGAGRAAADPGRRRGRSTSRTSTTSTRTPPSASARSRTSPGRACSTSRPAPSAAAASRSARPGTPRSRSPPSCSCWTLRDHAYAKAPWLLAAEDGPRRGLARGVQGAEAGARRSSAPRST